LSSQRFAHCQRANNHSLGTVGTATTVRLELLETHA
jgi:hypothetical protein